LGSSLPLTYPTYLNSGLTLYLVSFCSVFRDLTYILF